MNQKALPYLWVTVYRETKESERTNYYSADEADALAFVSTMYSYENPIPLYQHREAVLQKVKELESRVRFQRHELKRLNRAAYVSKLEESGPISLLDALKLWWFS